MTAPTYNLAAASAARRAQLAVRAELLRQVVRLWPLLNPKDLNGTFPAWLEAMIQLIVRYHGQSSQAAAAFYRAARSTATESPAPLGLIALAAAPERDWLAKALGFSGPGMLSRDTVRPGTALSTTLGTAGRIALEGGRATILNTVERDPVALGYFRITDGQPCAFCALLASRPVIGGRGAFYKTAESAGFAAHNDCGCSAAPMFSRDQQLPALSTTAADVYRNRGDGNALVAFRKAWADHQSQSA